MRAQIELGGTDEPRILLQDLDYMALQVAQLLHLAEASEAKNYQPATVDVAVIVEDIVEFLRPLADRGAVTLAVHRAPGEIVIHADHGALFMLLKNLVENAIQHSPSGELVILTVDSTELRVGDSGPGISTDEFPHLFDRF